MAWLAKDANGGEFIYDEKPTRKLDYYRSDEDSVQLPTGGILALLGREFTFGDDPIELTDGTLSPKTYIMQWVRTVITPPKANGEYTTRDTSQDCDVLQYNAAHNLWYDSYGRSQSAPIFWLDESAPITEGMVKDLPFINVDHDENGEVTSAICNAITDRYDVTKYAKGWAVGQLYLNFYGECDDLAHGIALCNAHHKKIILSQLK